MSKPRLDPSGGGVMVFTDGSASTRDRTGGWAWVALDAFGGVLEGSGAEEDTTISRMELMAPAMALCALEIECNGPCEVLIQSDSQYVVMGFMDPERARRANKDLWDYLETMADLHDFVTMEHIRGHQGNQWNERADELAGKARKSLLYERQVHARSNPQGGRSQGPPLPSLDSRLRADDPRGRWL